jgi:hypothetical protein
MDMTRSESKSTIEWWSISAAVSAAIFNILSSVLMNYQMYIIDLWIQQDSIVMNYLPRDPVTDHSQIFSQFFFLTPMFVVAIFRRHPAFTLPYLDPLLDLGRSSLLSGSILSGGLGCGFKI